MFKAANKDSSPAASISATVSASHLSSKAGKLRVTPEGGLSFVVDGGGAGGTGGGGGSSGKTSTTINQQGGKQKFFASRTSDGKWNLLMAPTSDPSRLFLVQPAPGHKFQVSGGGVRMESISTGSSQSSGKEETSSSTSNGCVDEHASDGGTSPGSGEELAPGTSKSSAVSPGLESSTSTSSACPDTPATSAADLTSTNTTPAAGDDSVKIISPPDHKKPSFFKSRTSREREALKASVGKKVLAVNRRGSKSTSPAAGDHSAKRGKKSSKALKSPKSHSKSSKLSSSQQESMSEIFSLMSVSPEPASSTATTVQSPTPVSTTVTTSSASCTSMVNTMSSSFSSSVITSVTSSSPTSCIQATSTSEMEISDTRPDSSLPYISPSSSPSRHQMVNISPPTSPLTGARSPAQSPSSAVSSQSFTTPPPHPLLTSPESLLSQPVASCSRSRTNSVDGEVCNDTNSPMVDTKTNSSTDCINQVSDCRAKTTNSDYAPLQFSAEDVIGSDNEGNIEKQSEDSVETQGTSVTGIGDDNTLEDVESNLRHGDIPEESRVPEKDLPHSVSDLPRINNADDEFDLSAYKPCIDNYGNIQKPGDSDEDDVPLSSLQMSYTDSKESDSANVILAAAEAADLECQHPRRNSRRSTAAYATLCTDSLNSKHGKEDRKNAKKSVGEKSAKGKQKESKSNKGQIAAEKLPDSGSDTDDYESTKSCKEKETLTLSKRQSSKDLSSSDLSFEFIDTEKFRGKSSPPEKTPEKSDVQVSDTDMEQLEPLSEKPMTRNKVSGCSESDSQLPSMQDKTLEGDLSEDCSQKDKHLGLESEDGDSTELLKEPSLLPKRSARAGASDTQDQFNSEVVNSELAVSGKQTKPNKRKKRKSELEVLIASQEILAERDIAALEDISDKDALASEDMAAVESHETNINPEAHETSEHVETASETTERESVSHEGKKKKKKKKKKTLKILINLAEAKVKNNLKPSEQSASSEFLPNYTQEGLVPSSETDPPQPPEGSVEDSGVHASGTDTEDQDSSTLTSAPETAPRKIIPKKKKNKKLKIIFGGGQETSTREIPDSVSLDCSSRTECDFVPSENISDVDPANKDHAASYQASNKDSAVEVERELLPNNDGTAEPSSVQEANKEKAGMSTCGESPKDSTVESTNEQLPDTDLTSRPMATQPPNKDTSVEPTSMQPPDKDQVVQLPLADESGSQQPPKKQRKKRLTELEKIIKDQEALARAEELRLADENSENLDEDNALSENEPEKKNSQENGKVNELDESAPVPEADMETSETEVVSQALSPPPKTKKSEKSKKRKKKKQKDPPASAVTVEPSLPQGAEDIADPDKTSLNLDDSQSTDTYIVPSEAEEPNSAVNSDDEDAKTRENRAMAKYLKSHSFTQSQLTEMFGMPFVVLERLSEKDIFFMSRRFRNARVSSRTRCSLHCRFRTLGYLCELKLIECGFRSGIKRLAEPLSAEGMPLKKKGRPRKTPEETAEKKKRKKKANKEGVASGENSVADSVASSNKGGTGGDKSNTGEIAPSPITVALSKPGTIPPLTQASRSLLTPVTSVSGLASTSSAGRIVRVAPPLAPAKPSYLMARASAPTPRFISISSMATSGPSSLPQIISLPPLVASTTGTSRIIIPPIMAATTTACTVITTATTTTASSSSSTSTSLRDTMRASLTQAISNSLHKTNLIPATTATPTTTSSSLLNSALISALSTGPVGGTPKQFFVVQMGDKRVLVPATALSTTSATTTPPTVTISSTASQPKVTASVQRPVTAAAGGTSAISTVVMGPNTPPVSSGTRPPPPLVPGSVARIVLSNRRPPVPTSVTSRTGVPTASTLLFSSRGAQRNQAWIGPRPTQASVGPRSSTTAGTEKRILVSPASQPQGIRVVISGPSSITPGSRFTVASSRGGGVFLASRSSTSLVRLPVGPSRPGKRVMTDEERLRKRARLEKKYPLPPGVVIKTEATTFGYGDEGKTVSSGSSARMIVSSLQQGSRTSVNLNTPIPVISANRGNPIIIRQASPGASSGVRPSSSLLGPLIIRVPNPTTSSSSGTTARVAVTSSNFTASLLPSGARLTNTITNTTGHVFSLLSSTSSSRSVTATTSGVAISTGNTRLTASTYVSTSSTAQNSASIVRLLAPPITTSVTSVVSTSASNVEGRNVVGQDDDDVYIVDSPSPRSEISRQGGNLTQSQPETPSSVSSSAMVSLLSEPQVVSSSSSPSVVTAGSVSSSSQATSISSTIATSSLVTPNTAISVSSASDPVCAVSVSADVPAAPSSSTITSSSTHPPSTTTSPCPTNTSLSLPGGSTTSISSVSTTTTTSHSLTTTSTPLCSAPTATSLLRNTPSPSFSSPSSPVPSVTSSRMASLGAMLARQATESGSLPSIDTSSLQSERLRRLKEALSKQMVNVSDDRRQRVLQALARQMSGGSSGGDGGDEGGSEVSAGGEEQGRTSSSLNSAENSAQQNPAQAVTTTTSDQDKRPTTDSQVVVVLDESDEREETIHDRQNGAVPDANRSELSTARNDVESTVGSHGRDDTLDHSAVMTDRDSSAVSDADKTDQGAENDVVILSDRTGEVDQSIAGGTETRISAGDAEQRVEEQSTMNVVGEEISGGGDITETPSTSLDKREEMTMETEQIESVSVETGQTTDSNVETSSREVGKSSAIVDDEGKLSSGQDSEKNNPVAAKESHTDSDARDRTVSDAGDSGVTASTKPAGAEDCVEVINLDDEQL